MVPCDGRFLHQYYLEANSVIHSPADSQNVLSMAKSLIHSPADSQNVRGYSVKTRENSVAQPAPRERI